MDRDVRMGPADSRMTSKKDSQDERTRNGEKDHGKPRAEPPPSWLNNIKLWAAWRIVGLLCNYHTF